MGVPNLFKLEKLKILAYADRARSKEIHIFEAMFNPTSFSQTFRNRYNSAGGISNPVQVASFGKALPASLRLDLLLDGTNVGEMGLTKALFPMRSVKDRIDELLAVAYNVQGETHEPGYLRVRWGIIDFPCRLAAVTVTYTSFERDGLPLRAELSLDLVSDDDPERQRANAALSSPDVSHGRMVRDGDTLPLLTKEIYGSSRHCLQVARANKLSQIRRLIPGQELLFPPLAK